MSLASASKNSSRDATYFLESVVFKVEDTLFQVPRYHFEANPIFSTTFTLPVPQGSTVEGSSESNPFELEGILSKDFQALLSVLYPLNVPHNYADITPDEWKSVLVLSTMWEFQSLRDLAIQWLSNPGILDPASKILLGEMHKIPEWLISGCEELIHRSKGPRVDEIKTLGVETTIRIYDLREARIDAQLRRYAYDGRFHIQKAFEDVLGPMGPNNA